jgi:hypothetical protein
MFCLYLHKDTERMNFNSSTTFMFFASVDAHAPPLFPSSECNAHFGKHKLRLVNIIKTSYCVDYLNVTTLTYIRLRNQ